MRNPTAFLSGAPQLCVRQQLSRSHCSVSHARWLHADAPHNPVTFRAVQRPRRQAVRAAATTLEVTSDSFDAEVLKSEIPVLVDFYASWCGPCKLVAPLMDWAATEYEGKLKVVKIDTEENSEFVNRYKIHGLPTFAVFNGGEAFAVQEGALGKQGLKDYIAQNVPNLS